MFGLKLYERHESNILKTLQSILNIITGKENPPDVASGNVSTQIETTTIPTNSKSVGYKIMLFYVFILAIIGVLFAVYQFSLNPDKIVSEKLSELNKKVYENIDNDLILYLFGKKDIRGKCIADDVLQVDLSNISSKLNSWLYETNVRACSTFDFDAAVTATESAATTSTSTTAPDTKCKDTSPAGKCPRAYPTRQTNTAPTDDTTGYISVKGITDTSNLAYISMHGLIDTRLKTLITCIISTYYLDSRFLEYFLEKLSIEDVNKKISIFIYSKKDATNILPLFNEINKTILFKVITGPLPGTNNKPHQHICNGLYTMNSEQIGLLQDKYDTLRNEIGDVIENIKSGSTYHGHRLYIVLIFFSLVVYVFFIGQLLYWFYGKETFVHNLKDYIIHYSRFILIIVVILFYV
jgi:hypothetical protein